MTKQLSTTSIIGAIAIAALIVPVFALACTRTVSAPSAFNDLNSTLARFR